MESALLLPFLALIALAERLPAVRFERLPFFRRYFLTDAVCLMMGGVWLGGLVRATALPWAGALPLLSGERPFVLVIAAAILLYDLGAYVSHALLHRNDTLWRFHQVHHSSRALDGLATYRAHLVEHGLRHTLSPALLIVLGFPPRAVGIAAVVHTAWATFGHSNLRIDLRPLERWLITPRLHRLHHVPATGDRNLGTIFSVWDRLRGTLRTDPGAALAPLGVPGAIDRYPQSWWALQLEPFRDAASSAPRRSDFRRDNGVQTV